jgi:hypothetical protein
LRALHALKARLLIMFKDKLLLFNLVPFVLGLVTTLTILFLAKSLPPTLPLFYSLVWGDDQLVTLPQLLIIPSIMVLISLINLIVYWQLHEAQQLFKQMIITSSVITSLILTVSFIRIILIFI